MVELFETHKKEYWIENTTIERIDNLWHYCKENCKFATYKEQANNTSSNHIVKYKWIEYTAKQLSEKLWIPYWKILKSF